MLCAFMGMLSLQLIEFLKYTIASLWRCCDRRCTGDRRRTKQIEQVDYEEVYIGPEFDLSVRYATAVSFVLFVLMYSAAMPVLYFCLPVFFGLCFLLDRCLCTPGVTA